jgi:hypothetical protein
MRRGKRKIGKNKRSEKKRIGRPRVKLTQNGEELRQKGQ